LTRPFGLLTAERARNRNVPGPPRSNSRSNIRKRGPRSQTTPEKGITVGTTRPRRVSGVAIAEGRIRRILELIESESPHTISDLALELNLSESRLQHLFKQTTGGGLGHRLTEQRLQKAALLLSGTRMRIKEIAAAVGYEHTSSFTRAFERRFEQAPLTYRQSVMSNDGNADGE
jgi:transcriptional regulator GlxA family with amidase domain